MIVCLSDGQRRLVQAEWHLECPEIAGIGSALHGPDCRIRADCRWMDLALCLQSHRLIIFFLVIHLFDFSSPCSFVP